MCGRYVSPSQAAIERYWHVARGISNPFAGFVMDHFNVAPGAMVPILCLEDGDMGVCGARWGFVPHWWRQSRLPGVSFNARSEEAATKPMWRHAYAHSRCLVPARGWYEWQKSEVVDGETGEVRTVKQPYYLHVHEELLAFAGLLGVWTTPNGARLVSCSVLTREAAGIAALVHNRMPVVLEKVACSPWLDPQLSTDSVAELVGRSETDIEAYPVSTRVNDARNDSPDLIGSVGNPL